MFKIKPQTLSDILSKSHTTKEQYEKNKIFGNVNRIKNTKFLQKSMALVEWFSIMRSERPGLPIIGKILRRAAIKFKVQLNDRENIDMN